MRNRLIFIRVDSGAGRNASKSSIGKLDMLEFESLPVFLSLVQILIRRA